MRILQRVAFEFCAKAWVQKQILSYKRYNAAGSSTCLQRQTLEQPTINSKEEARAKNFWVCVRRRVEGLNGK